MSADPTDEIIQRDIATDGGNPGVEIAAIIGELENTAVDELATVWGCIDDVLVDLFSDPPSAEAQVEVSYSYEGYRVTVDQNGHATFVKVT